MHKCLWCEKDFSSGLKKTKFCSFKCSGKHKNNVGAGEAFCKQCKVKFKQKNSKQLFCSTRCKSRYNGKNIPTTKVTCSYCHSPINRPKNKIGKQADFFCDITCQSNYRSENSLDSRVCEECGSIYQCKKIDKLRFCGRGCQSAWQSRSRAGKNSATYNHNFSDSDRIKNCEQCGLEIHIELWQKDSKKFCSHRCQLLSQKKSLTKPHRIVSEMLTDLNIEHDIEYGVERFSVDCYLNNFNVAIEVMGDYWHCNPEKFNFPINKTQENGIKRDKKKDKILKDRGIRRLYLWETDVYNFSEKCIKLIIEVVENEDFNGCHSFNYLLDEQGFLKENNSILFPYWK